MTPERERSSIGERIQFPTAALAKSRRSRKRRNHSDVARIGPDRRPATEQKGRTRLGKLAKSPYATLYTGGSDGFVVSIAAPIATGWSDPFPGGPFIPLWTSAFHGAPLWPGYANHAEV